MGIWKLASWVRRGMIPHLLINSSANYIGGPLEKIVKVLWGKPFSIKKNTAVVLCSKNWKIKNEGAKNWCSCTKIQSWWVSTAERWALWWHLSPVAIAHNSSWVWWLWKNSPTGKATFSIQNSSRKAKMRVCNDCLFIVFKMQNYKIIMNCKKKMLIMPIINFAKGASRTGKNFGKVYTTILTIILLMNYF